MPTGTGMKRRLGRLGSQARSALRRSSSSKAAPCEAETRVSALSTAQPAQPETTSPDACRDEGGLTALPDDAETDKLEFEDTGDASCSISTEKLLQTLDRRQQEFESYRQRHAEIRKVVMPVFRLFEVLLNAVGEAADVKASGAKAVSSAVTILFRAARNVTAAYDGIIDMFNDLREFLDRLDIYNRREITPALKRVIANIVRESLSMFDLVTKMIDDGRLVRFGRDVLGIDEEYKKALARLGRLTQQESRVVLAEIYTAVADPPSGRIHRNELDPDGYSLLSQGDLHFVRTVIPQLRVRYKRSEMVTYTTVRLARLRADDRNADEVLVKTFPARNEQYTHSVEELKRLKMHEGLNQLLGMSRLSKDSFLVVHGGQFTAPEYTSGFVAWKKYQFAVLATERLANAFIGIRSSDIMFPSNAGRPRRSGTNVKEIEKRPIVDTHGQIYLDPDYLDPESLASLKSIFNMSVDVGKLIGMESEFVVQVSSTEGFYRNTERGISWEPGLLYARENPGQSLMKTWTGLLSAFRMLKHCCLPDHPTRIHPGAVGIFVKGEFRQLGTQAYDDSDGPLELTDGPAILRRNHASTSTVRWMSNRKQDSNKSQKVDCDTVVLPDGRRRYTILDPQFGDKLFFSLRARKRAVFKEKVWRLLYETSARISAEFDLPRSELCMIASTVAMGSVCLLPRVSLTANNKPRKGKISSIGSSPSAVLPPRLYFFEHAVPIIGPIQCGYGYWSTDEAGEEHCSQIVELRNLPTQTQTWLELDGIRFLQVCEKTSVHYAQMSAAEGKLLEEFECSLPSFPSIAWAGATYSVSSDAFDHSGPPQTRRNMEPPIASASSLTTSERQLSFPRRFWLVLHRPTLYPISAAQLWASIVATLIASVLWSIHTT